MIVAIARNRGIGLKNTIPWRLGADLKYFKTSGDTEPFRGTFLVS